MAEAAMVAHNIGNMFKSDNTRETTHENIMSRVRDLEHKTDDMDIDLTHLEGKIGDLERKTDTDSHSNTMFKKDAERALRNLHDRLTDLEHKVQLQDMELRVDMMTTP